MNFTDFERVFSMAVNSFSEPYSICGLAGEPVVDIGYYMHELRVTECCERTLVRSLEVYDCASKYCSITLAVGYSQFTLIAQTEHKIETQQRAERKALFRAEVQGM